MKKLILALTLVLSSYAMADIGPSSSWQEIQSAPGVHAEFPQLVFERSIYVSVDGTCVQGDMIRTKNPLSVCVEYGNLNCKAYELKYGFLPRKYEREVCVEENEAGCLRTVKQPAEIPAAYHIPVYRSSEYADLSQYLFSKHYELEACQN